MRWLAVLGGAGVGLGVGLAIQEGGLDAVGFLMIAGAVVGGLLPRSHRSARPSVASPPRPVGLESRGEATAAFLAQALSDGLIDLAGYERLHAALLQGAKVTARAPVPSAAPAPPPGSIPPSTPSVTIPPPPYRPVPPVHRPAVEPEAPSPVATWFGRIRESVVSDVAVHGLAYLGVLLVFAGTLGFILFSFGSLTLALRPWAELAIPTVLLASALFLRHRGAPVVATALGILGGILLVVVLLASYVDGAVFPPELHGSALGWAAIATSLVLAGGYAASALWRADSSLRYLAAPLVWTAAWSAGLLLADAPADPLKNWTSAQFAFMAIGVAATSLLVVRWPDRRLSEDARPSLVPGAVLALGAGLLLAFVEGWPWWTIVILGLASLVTCEALADRLGVLGRVLPAPLLWLAIVGVQVRFGTEVAGPLLVAASIALLEVQTHRGHGGSVPVAEHAFGTVVGLGLAFSVVDPHPWAVVAALAPLTAWAHVRRVVPLPGLDEAGQRLPLQVLAATSPAALAAGLVAALPDVTAFTIAAVAAIGVGVVAARRPADGFFAWWVVGTAFTLGAVVAAWPDLASATAALLVLAATIAVVPVPVPAPVRVWIVIVGLATSGWLVTVAVGLEIPVALAVVATVAAAFAAVAAWSPRALWAHAAAGSWAVATVGSLVSVAVDRTGWALVTVVGVWTLSTAALTLGFERRGRGPVELARPPLEEVELGAAVGIVPSALVLVGLAGTLLAIHETWAEVPTTIPVAAAGLAVLEAASTRAIRRHRLPLGTVGIGSAVLAALACLGASETATSAWTLALGIASVTVMAPQARRVAMVWAAWAASGILAVQLARLTDLDTADLPVVVLAWSSILAVGALVLDDRWEGRRDPGVIVRRPSLAAPAVLGLAAFVPAAVLSLTGSDLRVASLATLGAVVVGVVAWLLRLGAVSLGSWALASVAAEAALPWPVLDDPWLAIPWAAVLGAAGLLLRPRDEATAWERRWDLPAFAVAALVTAAALAWSAAVVGDVAETWSAAGVLVIAVAWFLRSPWLTTAGRALVVIGALDAGSGWGAIVLAIVTVAVAWTAARYAPEQVRMRLWHQGGAAVLAIGSLLELRSWLTWSWTELGAVALLGVVVATASAVAVHRRHPSSVWIVQSWSFAAAMQCLAFGAAALAWPERAPAIASLLVAAAAATVIGAVWRTLLLTMAAPALTYVAWLIAVQDRLDGTPMWWAAPAGLVLLLDAALVRTDRRERDRPVADPGISMVEDLGMAALLIPPLIETITWGPARGLVAIAIGLLIAGWGVVTKVRRRLFGGAAGVIGAVVLMLAGPIARLVPQIRGPALWIALAILGLVLVVIATSLERGRARLAAALRRLDEALGEWE